MDHNKKFIIHEVEAWIKDGTITKEQGEKIKSRYIVNTDDRIASSDKFSSIFTSIGAILISLAALVFLGSNFLNYSFVIQVIILVIGISSFYGLSIWFKNRFYKTSMAFFFIANVCAAIAIFFLANKVYKLLAPNLSSFEFNSGSELSAEYAEKSRYASSLNSLINGLAGIVTTIVWIVNANIKKFRLLNIMSAISIPFSFFMLIEYAYLTISKERYFNGDPIYFIIIGVLMWFGSYLLQRKKYFAEVIYYSMGLLLVFIGFTVASETGRIINLTYTNETNSVFKGIWILILTSLCFLSIWYGVRAKKNRFLNTGLLFIGIDIIMRYVDWFWESIPKTLFFLIGGLVLIVAGIYFERIKKKLIKLIEAS